jgi:ubiquitin-activating enzyme E1
VKVLAVKGGFSFQIDVDTTSFGQYTRQGIVENVKVPFEISFQDLKTSYTNPHLSSPDMMLPIVDLKLFGRSNTLHMSVTGVHDFHAKHGRYPDLNDADEVLEIVKANNAAAKSKENFCADELEEEVVRNVARFSIRSIVPMTAFFGGIVAQEIVKFTGKYTPMRQWLHYDIFESLPTGEVNRDTTTRYAD